MKTEGHNKRIEERINATLPVSLGDVKGVTCDVSASGMFFETSATFATGDTIDFTVEFDTPTGKRILKCRGKIVRTQMRNDDRLGVAVKIEESTMEASLKLRQAVGGSR
jgi:hypothetical protein